MIGMRWGKLSGFPVFFDSWGYLKKKMCSLCWQPWLHWNITACVCIVVVSFFFISCSFVCCIVCVHVEVLVYAWMKNQSNNLLSIVDDLSIINLKLHGINNLPHDNRVVNNQAFRLNFVNGRADTSSFFFIQNKLCWTDMEWRTSNTKYVSKP